MAVQYLVNGMSLCDSFDEHLECGNFSVNLVSLSFSCPTRRDVAATYRW